MLSKLQSRFSFWRAGRNAKAKAARTRAEPPDAGIGAEAPIRKASEDRLRRADFADRIATVLSELSPREGRVFAIRGGWGFGKSSLKNLIAERLDARKHGAAWLDFNPWQWGDSDTIARALFTQMANRLGSEHSENATARSDGLRRYGELLTNAGPSIKDFAVKIPSASSLLTNVSVVAIAAAVGLYLPSEAKVARGLAWAAAVLPGLRFLPWLGRLLVWLGVDRSKDSLDKVRKSLEKLLRGLDRPLVVFVDDVDRLEPEQIRMVLRQVKANANLPNIVFVLLFQANIVERALNRIAGGDGRAFLEKIVQTNFDLPVVPVSTVHQILGQELENLVGPYATEESIFKGPRWGNVLIGCIQPMVRNLRDVRRLISSIEVHLPLHKVDDVFEVNIIDFLLLETLRIFEHGLYEAIIQERDLLLQERRGNAHEDFDRESATKLLDLASPKRRHIARLALKELFPPLAWAYGGMKMDIHLSWLSERRVCSARYYPRYFELQTAPGEMSESRFSAFLKATATAHTMAEAITSIEADGLLASLVARFDESVDLLPIRNAAVLLPGMFVIAQKLADRDSGSHFPAPWISAWRASHWFIKRIPANVRRNMVLQAFRQTEALSIAAMLITLSDPNALRRQGSGAWDPALDIESVDAMKAEWLRLINDRAADVDGLISERDLSAHLTSWKEFTGSLEEPRNWVARAIQSDSGFATLATRLMRKITVHTSGNFVSEVRNHFDKAQVDDFIGVEAAKAKLETINPADFPEHEVALQVLRIAVDEWTAHVRTPQAEQHAGEVS